MTTITGSAISEVLKGTNAADIITGGGGAHDELYGLAGADSLTAGSGNDWLDGGTGIDVMTGGSGNDLYYVDNLADKVVELAGGGSDDTIFSTVSIAKLADEVETGALKGIGNHNITGNDLANFL